MPRRSNVAIAACIAAAIALVAADIGTKEWAESALSVERTGARPEICESDSDGYIRYQRARRPGHVIVEDYFELEYAENCGAAFGLLRDAPRQVRTAVFGIAAIAATIVLLWLFIQGKGGPWFAWSVPLVVSGALGNLIDRVRYGYVVDFIHVHWRDVVLDLHFFQLPLDYPTFNVADIAITIGVILLLIDGFRREEPKKTDGEAGAPAEPATDDEKAAKKKKDDQKPAAEVT